VSVAGWLLDSFRARGKATALVGHDRNTSYTELLERVDGWRRRIATECADARVVALEADFSPDGVAALLALTDAGKIVVPLIASVRSHRAEFLDVSQAESLIEVTPGTIASSGVRADHPLYRTLAERQTPGLVLFSSGSTGVSKAALHDLGALLEKFRLPRPAFRTLAFLLFDHIGGINTLFHTLANGGGLVTIEQHDPDSVATAIEQHRVELLPTSPTFLNLLLLSEAWSRHDLSSLRRITYGTEMMPQRLLEAIRAALPQVELQQTYGMSELGILRSKSKSSDSLWMRIGGEGVETDVRDGVLWVRTRSAMLGYLNAQAPFDADGWFNTGDAVEVKGELVRFLGRKAEIINVGGLKVHPAEVENVLLQLGNVADAAVYAATNAITGQMVAARIQLRQPEEPAAFRKRLRQFCESRLSRHATPVVIELTDQPLGGERFKKIRP
jgi:acyl-coenzyme A synthetase/AMP-(fatty) acid ligase